MTIQYLKQASKTPATGEHDTRATDAEMLSNIESGGETRGTGGSSVGKFIKTVTWQRMTREANRDVGATGVRISRAEGLFGHALTGDDRRHKYFRDDEFNLEA